jgi:hypothetical protein
VRIVEAAALQPVEHAGPERARNDDEEDREQEDRLAATDGDLTQACEHGLGLLAGAYKVNSVHLLDAVTSVTEDGSNDDHESFPESARAAA